MYLGVVHDDVLVGRAWYDVILLTTGENLHIRKYTIREKELDVVQKVWKIMSNELNLKGFYGKTKNGYLAEHSPRCMWWIVCESWTPSLGESSTEHKAKSYTLQPLMRTPLVIHIPPCCRLWLTCQTNRSRDSLQKPENKILKRDREDSLTKTAMRVLKQL